eukprot:1863046-Rhodomonas_salina.1
MKPNLNRDQAGTALRTVSRNHSKDLTGIVRAQATTTKCSAVTVTQQWRWHSAFDNVIRQLKVLNTGLCKRSGKPFDEVIEHFIVGGDETCLLASAGEVSVLGDKEKKKHEITTHDSRVSITMYRVGSAGGATGPTGFLMGGVRKRAGYDDAWL